MPIRTCTLEQAVAAIGELNAAVAGKDRPLDFYRKLGRVVCRLDGEYGTRRIDALADQLKSLGVAGLESSTLRKAEKLVSVLSDDQLRILCRGHVSWRNAIRLTTSNLSERDRTKLLKCIANGIEPKAVGLEIDKLLDPARAVNARSVSATAGKAEEAIATLAALARNTAIAPELREQGLDALRTIGRQVAEHLRRSA